jgi:dTDP-4-dehydrorhamnose reductase
MIKVLITGSDGQLGSCFKSLSKTVSEIEFYFYNSSELDITNEEAINRLFSKIDFDYCINCAAYTQVDQAEKESELAHLINTKGPELLAKTCSFKGVTLIHISTDFVFDGTKKFPYTEVDHINPLGVYGASKLKGEQAISEYLKEYFIIRTSWLYSQFGKNFVKTILSLSQERSRISVVDDQLGSPTFAMDLAEAIVWVIKSKSENYGLFHFSNSGVISWYDFASKIFEFKAIDIDLKPVKSMDFNTLAVRPSYSVLDSSKFESEFCFPMRKWEQSLKKALKLMP